MVVANYIILEEIMKRIICVGILLGIFLVGCETSNDPVNQSVPDQTNGRITVINDEARLAARMTLKSETVPVDSTLRKTSAIAAFGLTYVAEIAPPTVNGQQLQATSVVLNANFAYVSYNMAGSSAIGAVDVIQVKGVKTPCSVLK